jgi:allantoinase
MNGRRSGDVLVRGGTLVGPRGLVEADVLCEGGRISAIREPGRQADAGDVVDARGLLVFPGFIDPHVHSRDPGATHKEDFVHSTRAAAASGITTIFEMPNTVPAVSDVETFRERVRRYESVAHVDFGLWALSLGSANLDQLEPLLTEGAVGIKLFWGYSLDRQSGQLVYNPSHHDAADLLPPPDNGEVLALFEHVAGAGGLLAAHCEDPEVLDRARGSLDGPSDSYTDLLRSRPAVAEAASIALAIEFSRATGCRFHVLHMATERAAALVRAARREGLRLSGETCPHYLTLTSEDYEVIGPRMKVFPLVRGSNDQQALWAAVLDGTIDSIGSDHAPHAPSEKDVGLDRAPAGAIAIETLVPLMLHEVARGRMSPTKLAWVLSEGTARIFGLHGSKGRLRPQNDADLTLVDLNAERTVERNRLHTKHTDSPWLGTRLEGDVVLSILRGEVIMRAGEPVGPPRGQSVRPDNTEASRTRATE